MLAFGKRIFVLAQVQQNNYSTEKKWDNVCFVISQSEIRQIKEHECRTNEKQNKIGPVVIVTGNGNGNGEYCAVLQLDLVL